MTTESRPRFYYAKARFSEPPFRPYTIAIGQAALAWNNLNEHLGNLFWVITGGSPQNWQALEIWQSLPADRPKREMLKAAAVRTPPGVSRAFPRLADDIKWICGEADSLEDIRNNVIHAPLLMSIDPTAFEKTLTSKEIHRLSEIGPHNFHLNKRASRLTNKDLLSEFRWCRDKALSLRAFADELFLALTEKEKPWPDRPRLPIHRPPKKP